jgi:aspartokinase-like uncharacterized kinase
MSARSIVIKIGGSLYDLPDLGRRLSCFLAELDSSRLLLVPGGGPTVEAIRQLDSCHRLGEDASHWLALQALSVNARFLVQLLLESRAELMSELVELPGAWERRALPILDPFPFALANDACSDRLPHSWETTSDSLAARVATVAGVHRLVLLKSCDLPADMTWAEATRRGLVDKHFAAILASISPRLQEIKVVNFRHWQPR